MEKNKWSEKKKDITRGDGGQLAYNRERIRHWNAVARKTDVWAGWGKYYHQRLRQIYQFHVVPGQQVLEIGCGRGDLLASLKPSFGVGVDFSSEMIRRAKGRYPHLHFVRCDGHALCLKGTFDIIILSDVVNDLWDVQHIFGQIRRLSTPRTRVLLNFYSHLWEQPLALAERLGLATSMLIQNWLTAEDISNLLFLADFEVLRHGQEILWPLNTPLLGSLANRYLVKSWPFRMLALTNFMVARPGPSAREEKAEQPLVSVVVPARNEAGNISQLLDRIPVMGRGTELVFVEGHSQDDTYAAIEKSTAEHPEFQCKLFRQTGKGKGDAVRLGFTKANGDILIILDADMTVPPEDLPRFYEVIHSGKAEFANGVRLVYPLEEKAMRFFNLFGNKFFSLAFSWLLGQSIKDTLCGTKAFTMETYLEISNNRGYFGDFDPFGDFDLLFGAARLNLKIVDLPVRYRERTYGSTNIERWKHGWLLLRMVLFAARRIKFV